MTLFLNSTISLQLPRPLELSDHKGKSSALVLAVMVSKIVIPSFGGDVRLIFLNLGVFIDEAFICDQHHASHTNLPHLRRCVSPVSLYNTSPWIALNCSGV